MRRSRAPSNWPGPFFAARSWAGCTTNMFGFDLRQAQEQLRLNAIELQMAPIRTAVHILFPAYLAVVKEGKKLGEFDYLNQSAKDMLRQLLWWTNALKNARENALARAA